MSSFYLFPEFKKGIAFEKGVESATGLQLQISKFDLGLIETHLGMKDLSLLNPSGYPDKVMFNAPEVFVDYDLKAIMNGKIHLEEVRLNLNKLVIVRNAQGELNLKALKTAKSNSQGKERSQEEQQSGKAPNIQIDHMLFKVGKVVYKDYFREKPFIKEFDTNIHEKFDNITSVDQLLAVIVRKSLKKIPLNNLANLDIEFLVVGWC